MTNTLAKEEWTPSIFDSVVKRHILCAIRQAQCLDVPFPAIQNDHVFPPHIYKQILDNLPDRVSYKSSKARRTPNPNSIENRKRITISEPQGLMRIDESKREFWRQVAEFFTSKEFRYGVLEKYQEPLFQRYSRQDFNVRVRVELIQDSTNYRIKPHTDATHKIITMLFYLPEDDSHIDLGTSAYAPKDRNFTDETGNQLPVKWFDELYRAPYVPNSFFSFMKNERSFHGRELIEQPNTTRNMMICSLQQSEGFVGY